MNHSWISVFRWTFLLFDVTLGNRLKFEATEELQSNVVVQYTRTLLVVEYQLACNIVVTSDQ